MSFVRLSRRLLLARSTYTYPLAFNFKPWSGAWCCRSDSSRLHNNFAKKFNDTLASQSKNYTTKEQSERLPGEANNLDQILQQLDTEARRLGRLNKKEVYRAFDILKNSAEVSSLHGLLLIRCCGNNMPAQNPQARTELAKNIFATLQKLGCQLDVSHYNALLKVFLENEHAFQPTEFLAQMEKASLVPNRVTYQRLIAGFCQTGDLEGASTILEYMKSKSMSINETVFNELIGGHAKAKDMSGAREMLNVMRNAKLEPSRDSFLALALGYALDGDIESIGSTLIEATETDAELGDREILKIIMSLAINGHSEKVPQLMSKLSGASTSNQDCMTSILELLTLGHHELAFKILEMMPKSRMMDGRSAPAGRFFIRQLVNIQSKPDLVVEYCQKMKDQGLNEGALSYATQVALYDEQPNAALPFIEEMQKQGFPVRPHYFWPMISQAQDENAVYSALESMVSFGCPIQGDTLEDYVYPKLTTFSSLTEPEQFLSRIKDYVPSLGTCVNPLVFYYLKLNDIRSAARTIEEFPVRLNARSISNALAFAFFHNTTSVEDTTKILMHMRDNPEVASEQLIRNDTCGQFLVDVCKVISPNYACLNALMASMINQGLYISRSAVDMIKLKHITGQEINNLLESLAFVDLEAPLLDDGQQHPNEMVAEELEQHLIELKSKGMNVRGVLRRLLLVHAREKNLDRVLELEKEYKEGGFEYTNAMNSQMVHLFTSVSQVDQALKHLNLVSSDFAVDAYKIINLANLLVNEGKGDEAVQLLLKYRETEKSKFDHNLENNVSRLLHSAADKGDVQLTENLFKICSEDYVKPNNSMLRHLLKVRMNNNDLDGALKELENMVEKYNLTPAKDELFKRFVMEGNSEAMQKILDMSTKVHGETNTLYDLAVSFIESQQPKQAKKVLETPGLRVNMARLENMCERMVSLDQIDVLEQFVEFTQPIVGIDRDRMYQYLLKAHRTDGEKALEVWAKLQEEDVSPSVETLTLLSDILRANGLPVPFQVPQKVVRVNKQDVSRPNEGRRLANRRDEGDVSRVGTLYTLNNQMDALVKADRMQEAEEVLNQMLSNGLYPRMGLLRSFLGSIGRSGDTATLDRLKDKFSEEIKRKAAFGTCYAISLLKNGQEQKLLSSLERSCESDRDFPLSAVIIMMQEKPHTFDRVLKLSEKLFKESGMLHPLNAIWSYYILSENYSKAEQVVEDYPELRGRLLMLHIFRQNKREPNVTMAKEVLKCVTSNVPGKADFSNEDKGLAYSILIDAHLGSGDIDTAEQVLKAGEASGLAIKDFKRQTLISLHRCIAEQQQREPSFQVPASQGYNRRQEES